MILEHKTDSTSEPNRATGIMSQELHAAYEVEDIILGRGGFGVVTRARLRGAEGIVRAVKSVDKCDLKAESLVRSEVDILRRLDHPCICRLFEVFEDDDMIYLVLEYIEGCELFDEILEQGQLDELKAAEVMRQIFSSLQYCHERNVVHCDLKPENIMVLKRGATKPGAKNEVKLIDFGLAKLIREMPLMQRLGSGVLGTAEYLAPEAFSGHWQPAADIWGAGMVLHCLLTGGLPVLGVREGMEALDVNNPSYDHVSGAAKELLGSLLQPHPDRRLKASDVLRHPWFQTASFRTRRSQAIAQHIIESFHNFHQSERLRRAALTALAMNLTHDQLEDLRDSFFVIDEDQDGRISREEFALWIACAAQNGGWEIDTQQCVDSIFESIDTDGSERIEYTEWVAAALKHSSLMSEGPMRAAFRVFDTDADGKISTEDVARVVKESPEGISEIMPRFDVNGDGFIDFEEFQDLIKEEPALAPVDEHAMCARPPLVRKLTTITL